MRLTKLVLTLVGSLTAFSAAAQGWIEFSDPKELFRVNLPRQPELEEIIYHSEFHAELPGKVYTTSEAQVDYTVTVINYADSPVMSPWDAWDMHGSIDYAAWNIRKRGGEITHDGWAQIDRIRGHYLQITNPDQSRTYAAMHLHGTRLYILEATAAPGSVPPIHFQQSLTILDENGDIVRYDTDLTTRIDPGR